MKCRPGDQPLPRLNGEEDAQSSFLRRVVDDVPFRRNIGIERYGTALQPFNGRDVSRDIWEEFLDLGAYIEQARREREVILDFVARVASSTDGGSGSLDDLRQEARELIERLGYPYERVNGDRNGSGTPTIGENPQGRQEHDSAVQAT